MDPIVTTILGFIALVVVIAVTIKFYKRWKRR